MHSNELKGRRSTKSCQSDCPSSPVTTGCHANHQAAAGQSPVSLRQHCHLAVVRESRRCPGRGLSYPAEQRRHSRRCKLPALRVWRKVGWKLGTQARKQCNGRWELLGGGGSRVVTLGGHNALGAVQQINACPTACLPAAPM